MENEKDSHLSDTSVGDGRTRSVRHIRGSGMLLSGKVMSIGIVLLTQVLLVRYLSKADFGAWGYALAVVTFFEQLCTLGLSRSLTRFIPIYHEREEFDKVFGTLALTAMTITGTSVLIISAVFLAPGLITKLVGGDSQPITLLFVMIFLVPVDAIDRVFEGLFASFDNPRAIFFRKYIVSPCLRLLVVLCLVAFGSSVIFVAYGYLAAAVLGILIYVSAFMRMLNKEGLLRHFGLKRMRIPAKEVFAFTLPLMTSDFLSVLMHTSDTLILGYFHSAEEIASYQAILPAVRINAMVMTTFGLLFTPMAARLFANNDSTGVNNLYWQSAVWLAVLTFSMFLLTFSLAEPLTLTLFGERYADSWVYLSILGFAYYYNAALGFNGVTLKVLGKIRFILSANVAIAILNVILNFLLIPRYGALGASVATAFSMILHNTIKQLGLRYIGGLKLFERDYTVVYLLILGAGVGLFLLQWLFDPNVYLMFAIAVVATVVLLRVSQKKLDIATTFPELLRIPLVPAILGVKQ